MQFICEHAHTASPGAFSSARGLVLNAIESAQGAVHMLLKPLADTRVVINVPAWQLPKPLFGFDVVHAHCALLADLVVRCSLFLNPGQS